MTQMSPPNAPSEPSHPTGWWQASDEQWYPPETHPGYQEPNVAGQPEEEEEGAGELVIGDGVSAPLLEYRASRFRGGRMFTPNVVRIWGDRVEEYEHHALLKKNTKAINYAQVAQVIMNKGLHWSDIHVESTGGHVIQLDGMKKAQAQEAKDLLDAKVHAARSRTNQPAQPILAPVDLADQLRGLAQLRDEGILTEEEFAAQKAKLLA